MTADVAVIRPRDPIALAQERLDELLVGVDRPRVLEAGCGSGSYLHFPPGSSLAGIDISEAQLAANDVLDEKILGNVQTYDLGLQRFDLIVCWDVLEHLEDPEAAVRNLFRATAPNGVVVLAGPHSQSVKGGLTRVLPYALHRRAYRWIYRSQESPPEPFPTFMRPFIAPHRLRDFARDNGMRVEHLAEYESAMQVEARQRMHLGGTLWRAVCSLWRALTFGRSTLSETDFILILRKGGSPD